MEEYWIDEYGRIKVMFEVCDDYIVIHSLDIGDYPEDRHFVLNEFYKTYCMESWTDLVQTYGIQNVDRMRLEIGERSLKDKIWTDLDLKKESDFEHMMNECEYKYDFGKAV